MKLLAGFKKNFTIWFLLLASLIFVLLRFPSIFEPNWYGDEGIYQAVGMLINSGAALYSEAWDNKPPLFLAFYALFNSDQFLIRSISLIFGLISVWLIFFLSLRLFKENKIAAGITTISYSLIFGSILIEGNIANTENFIILPILVAAYLVLFAESFKKSFRYKAFLIAGFLISIAFLSKIVAVFDFIAFGLFILLTSLNDLKPAIKNKLIPLTLGFGVPILLTIIYFFITKNFKDFMDAFLLSNVGYVGKENAFIIPQGFLIFKTILLGSFLLILYKIRNKIDKSLLFILLWFGFGFFSAFFSQRPYTHYLIMLLPSFCLLIGAIVANKKERFYLLGLLVLSYVVITNTFELDADKMKRRVQMYYLNYISYSLGNKDINSYRSFFDRNTPRDYEIANYIKANTTLNEKVFIWGNNPQIYKLANKTPILRYTAAYHITGFPDGINDMSKAIQKFKPKFIIIMPNANEPYPLPLKDYNERMDIQGAIIYEKIL